MEFGARQWRRGKYISRKNDTAQLPKRGKRTETSPGLRVENPSKFPTQRPFAAIHDRGRARAPDRRTRVRHIVVLCAERADSKAGAEGPRQRPDERLRAEGTDDDRRDASGRAGSGDSGSA